MGSLSHEVLLPPINVCRLAVPRRRNQHKERCKCGALSCVSAVNTIVNAPDRTNPHESRSCHHPASSAILQSYYM